MANEITIFQAKKIVTMNPSNPEGIHVAVREGLILGVGTLDEVKGWGEYTLDDTFKDKVLIPGLVEAHSHATEGSMWAAPYVGYFFRTGGIKTYLDGSIQGLSACVGWPGYYKAEGAGIWNEVPEQFAVKLAVYHRAGINVHTHCNGDEAVQVFIEKVEDVLRDCAWLDHRHTVQHCALTTAAQYRKMAKLGICANLFINHVWYWSDQHYEITVGPERVKRMNSCATAKREGVSYSFHSDAAITPLGQLHTMWCAVNRVTPKGRVVGETERISAYDALCAATVGAAYQLHMDHEIGTIECGKFADFAVLDESPLDVDPMKIKDIPVKRGYANGASAAAGDIRRNPALHRGTWQFLERVSIGALEWGAVN